MNSLDRIAAYDHFHDVVCCYLENQRFEVNAPKTDATAFESELLSTPVKMTDCSQLFGNYTAATVWKSATSTDGTTSLSSESGAGKVGIQTAGGKTGTQTTDSKAALCRG
ncbi:Iron/zinc purple acid phosphatase protein [Phytophthora cinnamomi]|uniref:Iron/zinc purple acid phosphatase protein n=1 Tax=Phytophthora cinnamomi TaxID=4785 RepID=UPI002A2EB5F1|nr:Iron/zinc purple acid phosphatase protein [Phytophthora cinnamomi]KAG6614166.1 Iron/zinc purple acid phosphatase protein [Phytophthora cinnamomi]KAJ8550482.1 hypothetical protein ON010_g10588 [Phytophthora cinnamomi]